MNKDALVVWGNRKATDINKRDVVLLLESIIERGSPASANNNFKIIRKMFRFAVQRDTIEHSPCNRYDKEKQQALEAWERKLNSIINATETAKVIPITRKAA